MRLRWRVTVIKAPRQPTRVPPVKPVLADSTDRPASEKVHS